MLRVERLEIGAVTALRAAGEIDGEGANALRSAVETCVADGRYHLSLDMSKVEYLSCMGAGAMLECLSLLQRYHGDLKIAALNIQSRRLLSTMGLGHVFESYESETSAVNGYKQEAA
ncbi:MAG TPA: anti-sigma factor antagonist [Candidatus Hydrogenedentes bacterium]|nr:anti-sigma factor antagonist [Candidatus Hydrogenedentota bacterium]